MTNRARRALQVLCWCMAVVCVLALEAEVPVFAAHARIDNGLQYPLCSQACGPAVSCDEDCSSFIDQGPLFDTTCGEYSGEPWNGAGNCLGTCGDDYCNEYNDEDPDTCYEDCGECGDDICTAGWEDTAHCYEDCGYCGDDICTYAEICGQADECEDDCNSCTGLGEECSEPFSACGTPGDVCNPQNYCVTPGSRTCQTAHGCCLGEIWFEIDCDWVRQHEGPAAGDDCEELHCMGSLGCGECVPSGPSTPRR